MRVPYDAGLAVLVVLRRWGGSVLKALAYMPLMLSVDWSSAVVYSVDFEVSLIQSATPLNDFRSCTVK